MINHRIKLLRTKRGLSQEALAKLINSNQNTIWKLETGKQELRIDQVGIFAEALGVSKLDILPAGFSHGDAPRHQVSEQEAEPWDHDVQTKADTPQDTDVKPDTRTTLIEAIIEDNPHKSAWTLRSRALENAGYLQGDILILSGKTPPKRGDIVCAQIYTGLDARTVFRIYKAPYLISATSDNKLNDPILIDNKQVTIMGTVTETLRISK